MKWLLPTHLLLLISLCTFAQRYSNPIAINSVNSEYEEYNPIVDPEGKYLYFTRKSHPENEGGKLDPGDIWISERIGDSWSEPVHAGSIINNYAYNAVIGFNEDGTEMYLHGKYTAGLEKGVSKSVKNERGQWGKPVSINIPYFKDKSEIPTGSLFFNGKIMLLSVDRYDSYGNEDIYVCFYQGNEEWSELFNLGSTINSPKQEFTPFLSADGKTLFFSSNGHIGSGSLDIYYSKRTDDTWKNWTIPVNLNQPVNTAGKDWFFNIVAQGDQALYVSSKSSDGYGNIYSVNVTDTDEGNFQFQNGDAQLFQLSEVAKELTDEEDVSKTFVLYVKDASTNESIKEGLVLNISGDAEVSLQQEKSTNQQLQYFLVRLKKEESYTLSIKKTDFIGEDLFLSTDSVENGSKVELFLMPISTGATVQLKHVLFQRGTPEMLSGSEKGLKKLIDLLNENPEMEVEIAGHTDNQGMSRMNIKLSQERADAVKQWLIEAGINEGRLIAKGYGGARPVSSNASEETRKLNRRVEFTILKY